MQARQLHLDFVPVYVFLSGSRKILSRIHFVNNGFKSQGHAFAWLFYYQVPQESSSIRFVVKSSLTGLTIFQTHTQRQPEIPEVRDMRMPYKQDFIAALLAAKEQGIGALLAFMMAYLRGRYNGGAMAKTLIDAVMCAMIAWFVRDLLDFIGLSSNLAYIASVFIGYIGTDSIGNLIKKFAARKAGVDDANQS